MRPSLGLRVAAPSQAAGRRTEPPMSVPTWKAPQPAAAAAPAPELEPPTVQRGVPRAAGDAVQARDAGGEHAPVGHRRGADDDAAGLEDSRDDGRVAHRDDGLVGCAPGASRDSGAVQVLLDGDGHPVEVAELFAARPAHLTGMRVGEHLLGVEVAEGVDQRVALVDVGEEHAGDLDRRELAARVGGCE